MQLLPAKVTAFFQKFSSDFNAVPLEKQFVMATLAAAVLSNVLGLWEYLYYLYNLKHVLHLQFLFRPFVRIASMVLAVQGYQVMETENEPQLWNIAMRSLGCLPIVLINASMNAVRTSYTICCCTHNIFCVVKTYHIPLFVLTEDRCFTEAEDCTLGFWRILFNGIGSFGFVITFAMITVSQMYLYGALKQRRSDADEIEANRVPYGNASAAVGGRTNRR